MNLIAVISLWPYRSVLTNRWQTCSPVTRLTFSFTFHVFCAGSLHTRLVSYQQQFLITFLQQAALNRNYLRVFSKYFVYISCKLLHIGTDLFESVS